jgi:cytochrome oxidase Cu insertion factor (SCO1/SenC/PrrC family)
MRPLKVISIGVWALAVACVGAYFIVKTTAASEPAQPVQPPLPELFEFEEFAMTNHRGEPFSTEDVAGQPWIGFIFLTHCPTGACPVMVAKMDQLQDAVPDERVQFVSFSVDPDRDTPASMTQFVEAVTGDTPGDRWHLLTGGTRASMTEFANNNNLAVGEDFGHSTQFLLIDGTGTVRGLYGNSDASAMSRLTADTQRLLEEGV